MSDVAKSHLPGYIQPQLPNFVWDNPLAHNSVTDYGILHGTSGADVFVFDVGPALAAQSGGSTGSAYLFWDYIDNFQPGVDQIAFINAPGEFISYSTANGFVSDPIGNPLVADGVATAEGGHFIGPTGGQVDWRYVVAARILRWAVRR
jgi:hypothetical protein